MIRFALPHKPIQALLCVAALLVSACGSAHDQHSHASAEYIANSAILVESGPTKILFDPIFDKDYGQYQLVAPETQTLMMAGLPPFDGVDAVFVSHAHGDHFAAKPIVEYILAHPDVKVVLPRQAIEMINEDVIGLEAWDDSVIARLIVVDMEAGDAPRTITFGDITATAVRIPHAGWPAPARAAVQNMVYRVTLGSKNSGAETVMHMGDADPNRQHFTPHKHHWEERRTDTAFPPYWFLTSEQGRDILTEDMNVANSTGVHVPKKVPDALAVSGADYFSVPGETREVGE